MAERAWLMLAYGDDRVYGGNEGYSDNADHYSFDSRVPNWKQVGRGDLAIIAGRSTSRGAPEATGIALVQEVTSSPATKLVRRCPVCGHPRFKARSTKSPRWRCDNGHEFAVPIEQIVEVTALAARFGDSYRPAIGVLSSAQLKEAQVHRGDGNSIRPLDPMFVRRHFVWDPIVERTVDPRGYPDPAAAAAVDAAALPIGRHVVEERFPGAKVEAQAHGNPGFDFLVTDGGDVVRYVELKSTTTSPGGFYMSQYQRMFSRENAGQYSLLILAGLDLRTGTCSSRWFDGSVDDHFTLRPTHWRGDL